jgi:hypothetical protein
MLFAARAVESEPSLSGLRLHMFAVGTKPYIGHRRLVMARSQRKDDQAVSHPCLWRQTSASRHESESRLGSSTDASRATGKPRRSTRRPRNLSEASGVTTHTKDLSVRQGKRRRTRSPRDLPSRRPQLGRLTWIEPDGRHERTSARQDRDAATAFEGRGSVLHSHPTGLLAL